MALQSPTSAFDDYDSPNPYYTGGGSSSSTASTPTSGGGGGSGNNSGSTTPVRRSIIAHSKAVGAVHSAASPSGMAGMDSLLHLRNGSILKTIPLFDGLRRKTVGALEVWDDRRLAQLGELLRWVTVRAGDVITPNPNVDANNAANIHGTNAQGSNASTANANNKSSSSSSTTAAGAATAGGASTVKTNATARASVIATVGSAAGSVTAAAAAAEEDDASMYIIVRGRCAVATLDPHTGAVVATVERGRGDYFGEWVLLHKTRLDVAVTALTDGVLLRLRRCDYERFTRVCPAVGMVLQQRAEQRTATQLRQIPLFLDNVRENKPWSKMDVLAGLFVFEHVPAGTVVFRQVRPI